MEGQETKILAPFERRLRTAARLALYSSLVASGVVAASLFAVVRPHLSHSLNPDWAGRDWLAIPAVARFQQLLRVDTSPTGSEEAGAELLASFLEDAGIEATIERFPGHRANLWAFIEGQSPEALVLHNHLDVEPAPQPELWRFPPFSGTIEGPFIWSRGAFDMKSLTAAQLEAMLSTKRRIDETGELPKRSLLFLATSGEETGSEIGTRWILRQHPELTERFWVVLTEGGVLETVDRESVKYWGTAFAQKRFVEVFACSPSRQRLLDLKADLESFKPRVLAPLVPDVRDFLEAYAPSRTRPLYVRALERPTETLLDQRRFNKLPGYIRSLFQSEVAVFNVTASPEGGFRLRLFLHVHPGAELKEMKAQLLPGWMVHGVSLSVREHHGTREGSSLEHPAWLTIQRVLETQAPGRVGPYFLSYYMNDSRYFRALGIPSYGMTPFRFFVSESLTMNHRNEKVSLPAFVEGVALHDELVQALLSLATE